MEGANSFGVCLLIVFMWGTLYLVYWWPIKEKGRSRWWIALCFLCWPTPLFLENKVRKQREVEEFQKKYRHL